MRDAYRAQTPVATGLKVVDVEEWFTAIHTDDTASMLADAAWSSGARAPLLDSKVLQHASALHVMSHELKPRMIAADQRGSGTCWAFAGLAILERKLAVRLKLQNDFRLSVAYLQFYDKLEKAYAYLMHARYTRHTARDSRLVQYLLSDPVPDGGSWASFVALVEKYGIVPEAAYPQSAAASNTEYLNRILCNLLQRAAHQIRTREPRAEYSDFETLVSDTMFRVQRVLCICLGAPPRGRFGWEYHDKKDRVKRKNVSPGELYELSGAHLDAYASLSNVVSTELDSLEGVGCVSARPGESCAHTVFEVANATTVWGCAAARFTNVSGERLAEEAKVALDNKHAVFCGVEFGPARLAERGILHHDLVHYKRATGVDPPSKGMRYDIHGVQLDHALLLVGYHDNGGKVVRWLVQNSHGTEHEDGYLSMSHGWFLQHVFYITVPAPAIRTSGKPTIVQPWSIFGALARH